MSARSVSSTVYTDSTPLPVTSHSLSHSQSDSTPTHVVRTFSQGPSMLANFGGGHAQRDLLRFSNHTNNLSMQDRFQFPSSSQSSLSPALLRVAEAQRGLVEFLQRTSETQLNPQIFQHSPTFPPLESLRFTTLISPPASSEPSKTRPKPPLLKKRIVEVEKKPFWTTARKCLALLAVTTLALSIISALSAGSVIPPFHNVATSASISGVSGLISLVATATLLIQAKNHYRQARWDRLRLEA